MGPGKTDQLIPKDEHTELHILQNGDANDRQLMHLDSPPKHIENKKITLWVMYLTMLFSMMAIAIEISSSWPYLQRIDQNISPNFLGWANVGFNGGAILGDLIFGKWMTLRPQREPILASLVIMMLSGFVYAFAQGMGKHYGPIAVFISRVLLGLTRGNMTCTRAVVSEYTTSVERSAAMANLVIAMCVGFASGSAIQAAMVQIGEDGVYIKALRMHLNLYTIPAYLIVLLAIVNISIIIRFIKPRPKKQAVTVNRTEVSKSSTVSRLACLCLIFMFSLVNFDLSCMETLMTPFIQHQYALTRARAVFFAGLAFTSQGLIGIVQNFGIKFLSKRLKDRTLLACAFSLVALSFFMYIPLGNTPLKLTEPFYTNRTSNISVGKDSFVGCPAEYEWCRSSPQIWMPKYVIGVILFGLGYSSCLGLIISLFSKLIGPGNQSASIGLISAFGNIGRLTAPITGAESYVNIGPRYTFLWILLLDVIGLCLFTVLYKYMVPSEGIVKAETEDRTSRLVTENQTDYNQDSVIFVTPV